MTGDGENNQRGTSKNKNLKLKIIILLILIIIEVYLYWKNHDLWTSNISFSEAKFDGVLLVIFGVVMIGIVVAIISMIHGGILEKAGFSHEEYKKKYNAPMKRSHKILIVAFVMIGFAYAIGMYLFYPFPN